MQKPIYAPEDEQLLMTKLWSPKIADDPEAFVLYAFPWGQAHTPLAKFKGPRKWQRDVLRDIAAHIKANKGQVDMQTLRAAIAAGRGIGKSALVSWLILWMLTTRIGSTVIVSANSEAQLRSVTWGELTKWSTMVINAHWWEISATKLMPAQWLTTLVERDLKAGTRYWAAEGKLWSEENPDSYAGAHNHSGMMLIFDEASGIPDAIWAVGAGFFTEPTENRFFLAFSNPRRNSGYFFECFNAKRDFWNTKNIDARTVEDTDKQVYAQIIEEYGEDSPQARIEVYGEFPLADDDQFISAMLVDEAMKRPQYKDETAGIVIGIDPARSGLDSTVIAVRQGRDLIAIKRYQNQDTMQTVGAVIEAIEEYKPVLTVIDEGGLGYGILDRLNEQRYKVRGVNFGWRSKLPVVYFNKRAELWGAMRDWIKTASLPPDRRLKADLTGVQQKLTSSGAIQLESKKDMKARGLASPDAADAIAVTFAFPIARREPVANVKRMSYSPHGGHTSWMGA
ncbi:MAG: terminase [Armatimonadia bacterium]